MVSSEFLRHRERYQEGEIVRLNPMNTPLHPHVVKSVIDLDNRVMYEDGEYPPPHFEEDYVANGIRTPGNYILGILDPNAEDPHALAAYAWFQKRPKGLFVLALGVGQALQGSGYSRVFLDEADHTAARLGLPLSFLEVDPTKDKAIEGYGSAGYRPTAFKTYEGTNTPRLELEKIRDVHHRHGSDAAHFVSVGDTRILAELVNSEIRYSGTSVMRHPDTNAAAIGLHIHDAENIWPALELDTSARFIFLPPDLPRDTVRTGHAKELTQDYRAPRVLLKSEDQQRGTAISLMSYLKEKSIEPEFYTNKHMKLDVRFDDLVAGLVQNKPVMVGPLLLTSYGGIDNEGFNGLEQGQSPQKEAECDVAALFRDLQDYAKGIVPVSYVYEYNEKVLSEPYFRSLSDHNIIDRKNLLRRFRVISSADKPGRDFLMYRTAEQNETVDRLIDTLKETNTGEIFDDSKYVIYVPNKETLEGIPDEQRDALQAGILLKAPDSPSDLAWDLGYHLSLDEDMAQVVVRDTNFYNKNYPAQLAFLRNILDLKKFHAVMFDSEKVSQEVVRAIVSGHLLASCRNFATS